MCRLSDRACRTSRIGDVLATERPERRADNLAAELSMVPLAAQPASLVTTVIGQLSGLPPVTAYLVLGYLLARLLIPVLLIALAGRSATPTQRIGLVRSYLRQTSASARAGGAGKPHRRRPGGQRRPGDR
ncbi:hypothetical protein BJF90_34800 [Pseudonocardia sp. CNS-004]|nr:hypothetical protein BJF90_34800 [Pseudonocardia sp. CNS-004]